MWVVKHDPMMFSGHEKKTQALFLQEYIAYSLEISGSHATNLLLLLLSHFSHVRLPATSCLGFSRQEHWSGLPFPSPATNIERHKSKKYLNHTLNHKLNSIIMIGLTSKPFFLVPMLT